MKKLAMILSVVALIFAYTTTTVSAQKAPQKAKTEKVSETKDAKVKDAKAGCCSDKAKADCSAEKKTAAGCATPCTGAKATSGCCAGKTAATPVPAPASDKK